MPAETLELIVFSHVVRRASFARAAEDLALTPSGVSRIVSRLEHRLGARLLQRSTRKLALTEAGTLFYGRATKILEDLSDAEAENSTSAVRPRGTLRMNAPVAFGRLQIAPLLERLLKQFPELGVDLTLTGSVRRSCRARRRSRRSHWSAARVEPRRAQALYESPHLGR